MDIFSTLHHPSSLVRFSLLFVLASFCAVPFARAQVLADFEDGNVSSFSVEGDGTAVLNAANGNPGKCMQVDEPATGSINFLVLSSRYYGNWSAATLTDSIFFDFFKSNLSGGGLVTQSFLIEISGSGGTARFDPSFVGNGFNVWQHKAAPIDSAHWVTISGSWTGLLQSVSRIRIISEFVSGDELVRWDNIGLTFSPVPPVLSGSICSVFPAADGLDGWNFQNAGSVASITTDGNPPNCVRINDAAGLTKAIAPPKYRGNWSAWYGNGDISFDMKIVSTATEVLANPYVFRLAGPGGEVTRNLTAAQILTAKNAWATFHAPITDTAWTLVSGSWATLMPQVGEITLTLEFINGTETVYFDNFCITQGPTAVQPARNEAQVLIYPNPAKEALRLRGTWKSIRLYDRTGSLVRQWAQPSEEISLKTVPGGLYFLVLKDERTTQAMKLIVEGS